MRIFIAGGAGYIGTVLAPRLAARGYAVTVADLAWFGNHLPPEIPLVRKDVMSLTEADLAGTDVVIFLAGLSNDPMAEFSPALNYVHNAAAPANLAYLAKRAGVRRFVFASSCSVYGFTEDELWDEDSPTTTAHPYGISKLQAEAGVRHLQDSSFSVIILRKGTVCGYSPRMRLDLVVNTMFKTAMQDGRITVNNPSIWRPILAIQDAAAAYVRAVEAAPSVSGTFNVASENTTLGALADQVAAIAEAEPRPGARARDPARRPTCATTKCPWIGRGCSSASSPATTSTRSSGTSSRTGTRSPTWTIPPTTTSATFRALTADEAGSEPPQRPWLGGGIGHGRCARARPGGHRPAGRRRRRCLQLGRMGRARAGPLRRGRHGWSGRPGRRVCGAPSHWSSIRPPSTISTAARRIKPRPSPSMPSARATWR